MNWKDLTLSDINRLVEAIKQSHVATSGTIRAIIDRVPALETEHGRVTLESILQLLAQTGGSTVLPETVAALLHAPELPPALQTAPESVVVATSISPKAAHQIMGQRFFGVEQAMNHFGIKPTPEQLRALARVPFTEKVLKVHQRTHLLMAQFPLSITQIRDAAKNKVAGSWQGNSLVNLNNCNDQALLARAEEIGWHLLGVSPVHSSEEMTWEDQLGLFDALHRGKHIPSVQTVVYAAAAIALMNRQPLFFSTAVRTTSQFANGHRAVVGFFDKQNGLQIVGELDDLAVSYIGLAAEVIP